MLAVVTLIVLGAAVYVVAVGSAIAIDNDHGTGVQTFGFNGFSSPLAHGEHTAEVLWHTFPDGATSCVEERSLIILLP